MAHVQVVIEIKLWKSYCLTISKPNFTIVQYFRTSCTRVDNKTFTRTTPDHYVRSFHIHGMDGGSILLTPPAPPLPPPTPSHSPTPPTFEKLYSGFCRDVGRLFKTTRNGIRYLLVRIMRAHAKHISLHHPVPGRRCLKLRTYKPTMAISLHEHAVPCGRQ